MAEKNDRESIYVAYGPVIPGAYHMSLHYEKRDAFGKVVEHKVIEAGPTTHPDNEMGNAALDHINPIKPSPWGAMKVAVNRDGKDDDHSLPRTNILTGSDLSTQWSALETSAGKVRSEGYEYHPSSQNSNTFITTITNHAGLQIPRDNTSVRIADHVTPNSGGVPVGVTTGVGFGTDGKPAEGVPYITPASTNKLLDPIKGDSKRFHPDPLSGLDAQKKINVKGIMGEVKNYSFNRDGSINIELHPTASGLPREVNYDPASKELSLKVDGKLVLTTPSDRPWGLAELNQSIENPTTAKGPTLGKDSFESIPGADKSTANKPNKSAGEAQLKAPPKAAAHDDGKATEKPRPEVSEKEREAARREREAARKEGRDSRMKERHDAAKEREPTAQGSHNADEQDGGKATGKSNSGQGSRR